MMENSGSPSFAFTRAQLTLFLANIFFTAVHGQANFSTGASFYATRWTALPTPRGITVDPVDDVLVVSRSLAEIFAVFPDAGGNPVVVQITNDTSLGLTHALTYAAGYLYASSRSSVYRWPYTPGQRRMVGVPAEQVIYNIPGSNEVAFIARPIIFDARMNFYVAVGTGVNTPPELDSNRTRIRKFGRLNSVDFPIDFETEEVYVDGVRNDVGIDFDASGTLWGVENGITGGIVRPDLGPDNFAMFNPTEELNRFNRPPGTFYGYPYCFSSYILNDFPPGTQFAWHTFLNDGIHTDEWCRNRSNVELPALAMPAHEAPLGITFYDGRGCNGVVGSFPCSMIGDAFVSFHGSSCCGGAPPVGYRVARLPFDKATLTPMGEMVDVIFDSERERCVNNAERATCFRPVSAAFDYNGHMIVTVDSTGELFKVYYNGTV